MFTRGLFWLKNLRLFLSSRVFESLRNLYNPSRVSDPFTGIDLLEGRWIRMDAPVSEFHTIKLYQRDVTVSRVVEKKRSGNSIVSGKPAGSLPGLNKYQAGANGSVVYSRLLDRDPTEDLRTTLRTRKDRIFRYERLAALRRFVWAVKYRIENSHRIRWGEEILGNERALSHPCERRPNTLLIVH